MRNGCVAPVPWQAVAVELIRRRSGALAAFGDEELRDAAAIHHDELHRRALDGVFFLACDVEHPRRRLYQMLWEAQVSEARAVVNALGDGGARAIFFKGVEIGARYDGGQGIGSKDVDILVPRDALWDVKRILYLMGYEPLMFQAATGRWERIDYLHAARHEATAYELMPFVKEVPLAGLDGDILAEARRFERVFRVDGDSAFMYMKFDVHHNVLFNFEVTPLLRRAVPSALGFGSALSPADHLWFAIHRHYFEVGTYQQGRPRVLATIASLIADRNVDWGLLVQNALEMRAAAPCFYWLKFFQKLGAPVSDQALETLKLHFVSEARNWGWQLGRLFDVDEPFPELLLATPLSGP